MCCSFRTLAFMALQVFLFFPFVVLNEFGLFPILSCVLKSTLLRLSLIFSSPTYWPYVLWVSNFPNRFSPLLALGVSFDFIFSKTSCLLTWSVHGIFRSLLKTTFLFASVCFSFLGKLSRIHWFNERTILPNDPVLLSSSLSI